MLAICLALFFIVTHTHTLNLTVLHCIFPVCTGEVYMESVAPVQSNSIYFGVFAADEIVSALLQEPNYFLPTCGHTVPRVPRHVTLSKVNNGFTWAQNTSQLIAPDRLLPLSPKRLQPHLTGLYRCTMGPKVSPVRYNLQIIGKK